MLRVDASHQIKGRGLYNVGLNVFTQNTYNDLSSYDIPWGKYLDENRITDTIFRRTWKTDRGFNYFQQYYTNISS